MTDLTAPTSVAARAEAIERSLDGCWVVILTDPDFNDWSPWPVVAKNKRMAIAQARRDWREWCEQPGSAEVVKVYHRSWIGGIA
jgi:hypothetical protein